MTRAPSDVCGCGHYRRLHRIATGCTVKHCHCEIFRGEMDR